MVHIIIEYESGQQFETMFETWEEVCKKIIIATHDPMTPILKITLWADKRR